LLTGLPLLTGPAGPTWPARLTGGASTLNATTGGLTRGLTVRS
jgi:hypothetical protein